MPCTPAGVEMWGRWPGCLPTSATAGGPDLGQQFRAAGAGIATTAFLPPDYAMISGVIHDSAPLVGWRQQSYARLMSANNTTTAAPFHLAILRWRGVSQHDAWREFSLQRMEHRMERALAPA
jgi:hypothetical protein